jgi:hypothetical protein
MENQILTNQKVDRDSTQLIDFHQRRITNAAPSQGTNDYVVKQELLDLQIRIAAKLLELGVVF